MLWTNLLLTLYFSFDDYDYDYHFYYYFLFSPLDRRGLPYSVLFSFLFLFPLLLQGSVNEG